jgi:O-acetyl-ADP-ribose deacetylase (regulator of RNase III)
MLTITQGESEMKVDTARNYVTLNGDALSAPTGIIVHGCNCQGVMGAGIAAQVKKRYPGAYQVYRDQYESLETLSGVNCGLELGDITGAEVEPNKFIVNANTQYHCGVDKRYVDYEAVANCFQKVREISELIEELRKVKLDVVFPMIGAGLAGGNWKIIETIILETLGDSITKKLYLFP